MAGELRHRGPDGTGLLLDGRIGIAGARLAIVDLEGGDQPLSDERGRFWAMQNGEIYNYVELRSELSGLGHRFATASDTEVIAHSYEEWGPECLTRFNGDFALAVWDRERRELFLARDRFGVRPLFLAEYGGDICFASEGKALLRHPAAAREIDPVGVVDVFTTWSTLPDHSAFKGIRELPSAHYALIGPDGVVRQTRWWDMDFVPESRPEAEVLEELEALLVDATRIRLRADVPVGAYLSGGLDSSAVAAIASRELDRELVAFGLGFTDERFDETGSQERIARELGVDFHRTVVDASAIAELLPRAVELGETPLLRTAPAPLLALSAAVRDAGLHVVLTGEGADELFAGYDIFREDKVRRFWAREPSSVLRPLLFQRLNRFLAADLTRARGFLPAFYGRGLLERRRSSLQPPAALRELGALPPPAESGVPRERRKRAGNHRARASGPAVALRRDVSAEQGAVPRDRDLHGGLSPARAGRSDADGKLRRGPLPVSRSSRRGPCGSPPRAAAAARAAGEVRASRCDVSLPAARDRPTPETAIPRADR